MVERAAKRIPRHGRKVAKKLSLAGHLEYEILEVLLHQYLCVLFEALYQNAWTLVQKFGLNFGL